MQYILSTIRFRAQAELNPISSIYDEDIYKVRDVPRDTQTREISKVVSLQNTPKTVPPVPSTQPAKLLEGKCRLITNQEQFLQPYDGDIDNILIFSTTENILHLCVAETI